ncbi:MAG: regulatory protein RecX [Acidothermaceae bacterium]
MSRDDGVPAARRGIGADHQPRHELDLDAVNDPPADPASVARSIALNLLTAAPRTRAQLADAMRRRAVPDDVAAEVLDRFGEVGLIDDAAFAEAWVTSRQSGRGLAPRALANELRKRGVEEPVIAEAVSAVPRDDVESTARALVRRRTRAMTGLPTEVKVRRLAGMLARKGYPGDIAIRAVRDVLAEESVDVVGELGRELAEHIAADDL